MRQFRSYMAAFAALMLTLIAIPANAESASAPLLTVTNGAETSSYDRIKLEELGVESFSTSTIWTEGVQTFTGVPLSVLVEAAGVTEGTLFASAINDYTIEMPVADALQAGPMVAILLNGEPMSVRNKGPFWIVYPYDSSNQFQSEVVYSRSIWQLDRIEFRE